MYDIHLLARVLCTRASTCVFARARPLLAKMPPGLIHGQCHTMAAPSNIVLHLRALTYKLAYALVDCPYRWSLYLSLALCVDHLVGGGETKNGSVFFKHCGWLGFWSKILLFGFRFESQNNRSLRYGIVCWIRLFKILTVLWPFQTFFTHPWRVGALRLRKKYIQYVYVQHFI